MTLLLALLLACSPSPSPGPSRAPPEPAPTPLEALEPAVPPEPDWSALAPAYDDPRLAEAAVRYLRPPPEGFVDLCRSVPGLRCHPMYHAGDGFTREPLPGYGAPGAWLRAEPAAALARVQAALSAEGLGLVVYDAYRPYRATRAMVAWALRTGQEFLLRGYVARRSRHNLGTTVDLGLVSLETGEPLDMGVPVDTLDERAHTRNAEGEALRNRLRLKAAMEAEGFRGYSREWWHFRYELPGAERRDVPYGCFEPDEGAWTPPEGWERPGAQAPPPFTPAPCPPGERAYADVLPEPPEPPGGGASPAGGSSPG